MKKVLSSITFSFLLIFISGCTVVQSPAPTQTPEVKKEQKREAKRNQRDGRTRAKDKVVEQKTNKTQPVSTSTPKTTNNQVADHKSIPTQTVTTKPPKPVNKVYRLKVTLTDIQCLIARDGSWQTDDYGIQQYVVYKALGKEKKFVNRDINKFPTRIDLGGQVPNIKNMLINGDMNNQIHVKMEPLIDWRNRNMISNSLVFQITSKELEDPYASFKIYTWLKEYSSTSYGITSSNNDKVLTNNVPISVKVKDVIEILSGEKGLNPNRVSGNPSHTNSGDAKYRDFGSGYMRLANLQKLRPLVLEGPIIAHHSNLTMVYVWVQFELID